MKYKDVKELSFPSFDQFDNYKKYGISNKCFIKKRTIIKPYKIAAHCFGRTEYFEDDEMGLAEAIQWLISARRRALLYLGVEEIEE